jgi:RNA 3'-phosphate cyclase
MVEIDGAIGGGSVLRVGVGLAAALGISLRVIHIRRQRANPGLQVQHLAGLLATAQLCGGALAGAQIGSTAIEFHPQEIQEAHIEVQIGTAGSIGLALQPLQLACLRARHPVQIAIEGGGSFGKWAPPAPFVERVNLELLRRCGYRAQLEILQHGFYPRGGARARARFTPPALEGAWVFAERGALQQIRGISIASQLLRAAQVAERQRQAALALLYREQSEIPIEIETQYVDALSPGSSVVLWAEFEKTILGADALGERGVAAERIGQRAAQYLLEEIRSAATLDRHMADQIIPFLGIYGGLFHTTEITDHIKTNIYVVEKLTGAQFEITEKTVRVRT